MEYNTPFVTNKYNMLAWDTGNKQQSLLLVWIQFCKTYDYPCVQVLKRDFWRWHLFVSVVYIFRDLFNLKFILMWSKFKIGAREMTQCLWIFTTHHHRLKFGSQHPCYQLEVWYRPVTPVLGQAESGGFLRLSGFQHQERVSSRFREECP